nr:hypothetical protein [Candidatus Prometheoarchaeum syntrophicum]QEE15843.1 FG-GAP repeat protein [Candidatus Prometheoarchaeum syntrophicum]
MERTFPTENRGHEKSMIVQHIHSILRKKLPSVIRDAAIVSIGENERDKFIAVANQDNNLYILNFNRLEIFQKIEFSTWVRCVSTADLTKNGKSEIIIGLGDNTLRVLKFDEETKNFFEFCSETFENFVNSCTTADLNGDSNLEIIAGSWDKTLRVFSLTESGLEELWRKELPFRIQSVKIADVLWNNRLEIVIIFKEGGLSVLNSLNGTLIWEFSGEKPLLACDIGILDSSGYPYIVTGGNDKNLYFLDMYGNIILKTPVEDRITSILISDINGNSRNEVLLGMGSAFLISFEFPDALLSQIRRRWRYKIHGVINRILTTDFTLNSEKDIIFAGYDYAINIINDFHYGSEILEPLMAAPFHPVPIEGETEEVASLFSTGNDSAYALAADESQSEIAASNDEFESASAGNAKRIRRYSTEIPQSELIPTIFNDVEYFETKAKLFAAFASGGLDGVQANKFFNNLKEHEIIRYQRANPRGYYLVDQTSPSDTISKPKAPIKTRTIQKIIESPMLEKAQSILEKERFFASKAILINLLRNNDIPEIEISPIFDYFKSKMFLTYSRSAPRGYTFIGSEEPSTLVKVALKPTITDEMIEKGRKIFRDQQFISSKAKIFEEFDKFNLGTNLAEKLLKILKDRSIISYSAKKPRGYHYIEGKNLKEIIPEEVTAEKIESETRIEDVILMQVKKIFEKTKIMTSKNAVLNKFEFELTLHGNYSPEQLFDILKKQGYLKYSRSAPRGYSFKNT